MICTASFVRGSKTFILHDGPPYAKNGGHIGHSVNKILKDIIVVKRTVRLTRLTCRAGDMRSPIELKVEQEFGKPGEIHAAEFRARAAEICRYAG